MKKFIPATKQSVAGFTLMEVLVATSIFIIMVLAILGIFSSVIKAQSNTLAQTRLEREAQLVMETIVKSVRSSRVDYDEYVVQGIDLANPATELILINFNDQRISYRFNPLAVPADPILYVVNSGIPSEMTSDTVAVTALNFFISPETNPFVTGVPPATQPRVTIVLSLASTQTGETARATIQQTVPQRGGSY